MLKRTLALTLALICCLGVFAGCGGNNSNAGDGKVQMIPVPFAEKPTVQLYMPANNQLEVEGCITDKLIEKAINVNFEIIEMQTNDQMQGMLAQRIVPDLTYNSGSDKGHDLGQKGAYINIYDYLDYMPNVKAFLEKNQDTVKAFEDANGALYALPIGADANVTTYCWIWRKDILDKHNLSIPTTQKEWEDTIKTLKGLYPSSYPFILRDTYAYDNWWLNWGLKPYTGTGCSLVPQLDGKVDYPFIRPEYKEWITYMRKLIVDGLLYEGWQDVDTSKWYEFFANDRSFVTWDKLDRIPYLEQNVGSVNPNVDFVASPGFAFGSKGVDGSYADNNTYSYFIGNNKNLSNTLAYLNWLYSEEGMHVTNWGAEGETYTVDENGEKNFKPEILSEFAVTGLTMPFLSGAKKFDAYAAAQDPAVREDMETILPHATHTYPTGTLFNSEEAQVIDVYKVGVNEKAKEYMAKFMLGDKDIEKDWDAYLKDLYDLGLQKVIDVHLSAYKRQGIG